MSELVRDAFTAKFNRKMAVFVVTSIPNHTRVGKVILEYSEGGRVKAWVQVFGGPMVVSNWKYGTDAAVKKAVSQVHASDIATLAERNHMTTWYDAIQDAQRTWIDDLLHAGYAVWQVI